MEIWRSIRGHDKNGCLDNSIENLRWDTPKNNQLDKIKHGTNYKIKNKDLDAMFLLVSKGMEVKEAGKKYGVGREWTYTARQRAKRGDYTLPPTYRKDYRETNVAN